MLDTQPDSRSERRDYLRPGCDVAGGAYGLVYITSVKIKLLGARPHALSAILLEAMDAARKNLAKAESS